MSWKDDIHAVEADAMLNLNGLGLAEDLTGVSLSDDRGVAGLAFVLHQEISGRRRALLSELTDTYWKMEWGKLAEIVTEAGFTQIASYTYIDDRGVPTENLVAADPKRKLILQANSHTWSSAEKSTVSKVTVYGVVDGGMSQAETVIALVDVGGSTAPIGETHRDFYIDGREGLKLKLQKLEEAGIVFTDWIPEAFWRRESLHLISSPEGNLPDRQAREQALRAKLPDWVKDFAKI